MAQLQTLFTFLLKGLAEARRGAALLAAAH
jgi:hypothetical protein